MEKKRIYKKRSLWSPEAEELLLNVWAEKIDELRGVRKNGHIYEEMALELRQHGHEATPGEVKVKLNNLTTKYRKEKSNIGPSGGSPSEWASFSKVHQIIGSHTINNFIVEESILEDYILSQDTVDIEVADINSEPTLPLWSVSPSPSSTLTSPSALQSLPSLTPSSSAEPEKKRKRNNIQKDLLAEFKKIGNAIKEQTEEMKRHEEVLRETDEKLFHLEVEKTNLLKSYVKNSEEMKSAFINFLNAHQGGAALN